MARLPGFPDETSLGQAPSLRSGRPVADVGPAASAMGRAIEKGVGEIGEGVRAIGTGLRQREVQDDAFELSRARSRATADQIALNDEFSRDADPATAEERYRQRLEQIHAARAANISNPRIRERFQFSVADDMQRGLAQVRTRVFQSQADSEIASAQDELRTFREAALQSGDPQEQATIIQRGRDRIEGLRLRRFITDQQAQQLSQQWVENYGRAWLEGRTPEERARILRPFSTGGEGVVERIIQVESGGRATARNPNSSALGLGQFTRATWLELIKGARPDLADGRSDAQLLELRNDPALSREMVGVNVQRITQQLQANGLEATPGNIYLGHFLGPAGAVAVLNADPSRPVSDVVDRAAVQANPTVLGGKTAGSVVAWASERMGATPVTGTPADFVPQSVRATMLRQADQQVLQNTTAASAGRGEQFERQIIDAAAGRGALPPRADIENDPILTEPVRNALLQRHNAAAADINALQNALLRYNDPNAIFNPHVREDRQDVDRLYAHLGGNEAALNAVVERTRILPASVGQAIRGGITAAEPARVTAALTTASNLIARHPTIFAGVEGRDDIEKAAVAYRHMVEDLGFTAQQASQRFIEQQTPEYRTRVQARIRGEGMNDIVNRNLRPADIGSAFDDSFLGWRRNPQVGVDAKSRQAMFNDYTELFREHYLSNGDISLSKSLALNQLKRVWGVTQVSGTATVMRYPPERAPAYAGVENVADGIATQAIADIREETGQTVDRSKIRLLPVPGGRTSQAYWNGQPPPYLLGWQDSNGLVHFLNPGRAFVADPAAMRTAQTTQRQQSFERSRAQRDALRDTLLGSGSEFPDIRMPGTAP